MLYSRFCHYPRVEIGINYLQKNNCKETMKMRIFHDSLKMTMITSLP